MGEEAAESKGTRRVCVCLCVCERGRVREAQEKERVGEARKSSRECRRDERTEKLSARVYTCDYLSLRKAERGMSETTRGGKKYTPEEAEGGFRPVADINARETSDCCKQEKGWRRSSPWPAFASM